MKNLKKGEAVNDLDKYLKSRARQEPRPEPTQQRKKEKLPTLDDALKKIRDHFE